MSALASLTLIAAAAQVTPAPLFDAFRGACYGVDRFDSVGNAALAAGWVETAQAQADPRIAAIIARAREAIVTQEPDAKIAGQLFRRKIDGRDVYLATSRVEFNVDGNDHGSNGCRAYDLDMPAAPTTATLTGWIGKPPTGAQSAGSAIKLSWQPWHDAVSLEITYVPHDNAFGKSLGVQGLILVSQAIGGF